ncbi:MAG TPA: cytochrome c oxidase assembly protein [Gemmatimonadales bacterium]|jgi:putative membrane protein|nr:cytochrome c oxidase assembly protein [Gemmatimonadales bacterium]
MQWWCSATGLPWTWSWQWYPGVHLLLLLLTAGWWHLGRRQAWVRRPWGWFLTAWLSLLIALDWPLGKLGAGYLASAHTLQFMLLTLLVTPALIKSIPADGWHKLAPPGSIAHRRLRLLARALPGLLIYDVLVVASHFPLVTDTAMTSQLGSLALDLSWLVAGLALWWPLLAPEEFVSLGVFGMIGYLFLAGIVPTIPGMMMVFSDWPLYRLYELAPRVWPHFTANMDIKLAGLSMKVIGDIALIIVAAIIFFRRTEADPGLVNA